MKNYVFFGGEKFCYQWIYAYKTKEIVEKIKELNNLLRKFQKNSDIKSNTKKYIDEILYLEKINFENIVNIFNTKLNFLKNFENTIQDSSKTNIDEEEISDSETNCSEINSSRIIDSKSNLNYNF